MNGSGFMWFFYLFFNQFCAMRTKTLHALCHYFPCLRWLMWSGYCHLDEKRNQLWNIHHKFMHGAPLQTCAVNDNQCRPASNKSDCGLNRKCLIWPHNTSILCNSLYWIENSDLQWSTPAPPTLHILHVTPFQVLESLLTSWWPESDVFDYEGMRFWGLQEHGW